MSRNLFDFSWSLVLLHPASRAGAHALFFVFHWPTMCTAVNVCDMMGIKTLNTS